MGKKLDFETSAELKRIFNAEFEQWKKRHRLGWEELSKRCGVSPAYLAHVGRYGRVPGKPVLMLLALNFEMKEPEVLFNAAGSTEMWPYDRNVALCTRESSNDGFLSVKLDMAGFVDAIKTVVRSELRPRSLRELLGNRPLKFGLNFTQKWLFERTAANTPDRNKGLVPDLCQMLRMSLQCSVETVPVEFDQYVDKLTRGEIDVFGPMMASPNSPSNILFSLPIHRMGMSALMRKRQTQGLLGMAPPQSVEDLIFGKYEIAVLKNSRAHLIANTRLKRPDDSLIVCSSDDEALDRILLKGISRPAHLFICNSLMAKHLLKEHGEELRILFAEPSTLLDMSDNSLAIRPDWPEVVPVINDALRFIMGPGGLTARFNALISDDYRGLLEPVAYG